LLVVMDGEITVSGDQLVGLTSELKGQSSLGQPLRPELTSR
jgi:hypothetical protein